MMTFFNWLFGAVGWLGVIGAVAALVAIALFARSVASWVWLAAIAALATWGAWGQFNAARLQAELDAKTEQHTAYVRQTEENARREAAARQRDQETYRAAETKTDQTDLRAARAAEARATRLRADAARLRDQAAKFAAEGLRANSAAATAAEREADRRTRVLADVFGGCVAAHGRMAAIADDAKRRGRSCEERHDNAVKASGAP